ncbi:MAG: hypothetical protein HOV87_30135 [Catenulispora sp.]|nr:hypothetical protein [Catenulispora sp.]
MAFGYGSDYNPPCDAPTTYLRVTPPAVELPFRDSKHCAQDGSALSGWVAGNYAPAQ